MVALPAPFLKAMIPATEATSTRQGGINQLSTGAGARG
jgi:hypothetical protein